MLLRIAAPLLDPGQVDLASRGGLQALRALPGVEKVFSRATPGELRLVVRVQRSDPQASAALVAERWLAQASAEFAPPAVAAVARGARARAAWISTGASSETRLAWAAQQALPRASATLPGASRVHLAGALTPSFALEVLTLTLADQGVALPALLQGLRAALGRGEAAPPLQDDAAGVAWLRDTLDKAGAVPRAEGPTRPAADVPLSRLVALRRGVAIAPREALVGRNPALLLLADTGLADPEALARQAAALASDAELLAGLGPAAQLQPLSIGNAQRFVLQLRPGQKPEPAEELAKRLLAVRDVPKIAAAVAVRGWDGIPAELDGGDPRRLPWTVWVAAAGGAADENLLAAREILSAGPWLAQPVAAQQDPALAWLLDQPAAAGVVISAADPTVVSAATAAIARALQQAQGLGAVLAGPAPQAARSPYGLIDASLARQFRLRPQDLADALALLTGELALPRVRGAWLSAALPRGEMVSEQGRLPLEFESGSGRPVDLALLQRVPSQEPLLDRLRVDGEPALFVLADSASGTATGAVSAFRLALGQVAAPSGVHLCSWTLAKGPADSASCVP